MTDEITESNNPATAAAEVAPTTAEITKPPELPKEKFRVEAPLFNGEIFGLKFTDGIALTDDAIKAHSLQEKNCKVFLTATGRAAWPKD